MWSLTNGTGESDVYERARRIILSDQDLTGYTLGVLLDEARMYIDCESHHICLDGYFCAVVCHTGGCGVSGDVEAGTNGNFCQPCFSEVESYCETGELYFLR